MEQYLGIFLKLAEIEDILFLYFESKDIKNKLYVAEPDKDKIKPVF